VQYSTELATAERAALAAGAVILGHYAGKDLEVETKADDSPVTIADKQANAAIVEILRAAFPDDAILSEESPDDARRLARRRVWIVDPLDGTRDFIGRTGQFAVHVALAVDGEAVVGAVYQPVTGALYSAQAGGGAWRVRGGERLQLAVSKQATKAALRVGVSRMNPQSIVGKTLEAAQMSHQAVPMGASSKHVALAAGALDTVICFGAEHEWDTAAPEVVIREAGGRLTDADGKPFRYNQADTLHHRGSVASNGVCHELVLEIVRPYLYDAHV
jgi:3'(2'), 5'-bisphosphate nucleotidase